MSSKFYYDPATGFQLGYYSDPADVPPGCLEAPMAPVDGRQKWINGEWVSPPPDLVPISARQIRLALNAAGLLAQTEAAIANGSEANKIEWQYASEYRRNHPLVATMATALSLTTEQIDAMWLSAMSL